MAASSPAKSAAIAPLGYSTEPPAPNLRDLAFLGDGERGALVTADATICWMCFPSWADTPVFGALLGIPTRYEIRPEGWNTVAGSYQDGTLMWRTRWVSGDRGLDCRDTLAYPGRRDHAILVRRLTAVRGDWSVTVRLTMGGGFDAAAPTRVSIDGNTCTGRLGKTHFLWTAGAGATAGDDDGLFCRLEIPAGTFQDLVLELNVAEPPSRPDAQRVWDATSEAWKDAADCIGYRGTAQHDVRHGMAILRGLTSPATGGMVAAATTSLPEHSARSRDFDYRFVWIRDQCLAAHAAVAAGDMAFRTHLTDFVQNLLVEDGPHLHPVYASDGSQARGQHRVDVRGYPAGTDVIDGNHAREQFQLDTFGEVLIALTEARPEGADAAVLDACEVAGSAIEGMWRRRGSGVWETEPKHWTHSRMMCIAGLRRFARLSGERAAPRWLALADDIAAEMARSSVHPSGRWMRATDDARIDASLVMGQVRGAFTPEDPRSIATLEAAMNELSRDGYIFRFPDRDAPLGTNEGAFLLCNFWMALACSQSHRPVEAARLFERARASCGPTALFSEEYSVDVRQLRGNIPQAFVHAALVEAAAAQAAEADTSSPHPSLERRT